MNRDNFSLLPSEELSAQINLLFFAVSIKEFYKKNIPIEKHIQNYPDGKPKYISIFDKKGNVIEETSFDESGVKTEIIMNKKN
jgi:hypothetical protein